jgi:hypothetical protein
MGIEWRNKTISSKALKRIMSVLVLVMVVLYSQQAHSQPKNTAENGKEPVLETLRLYVQLRLNDADWKDYSKYITWPDEPSWDCKWVVREYKVGLARNEKEKVTVSVIYKRIGLFCYDFEFKANPDTATVNYELVRVASSWKVNAPVPDYPTISADVLLKSLQASAENVHESRERREQFNITARKIADTLSLTNSK